MMNASACHRLVIIAWLVVSLGFLPGRVAAEGLSRAWQVRPVVIKAEKIPGLVGSPRESLALLADVEGRRVPIPFQIDPVDESGEFILGDPDDPLTVATPPGSLGASDEVVFMAGDLGPGTGPLPGLADAHRIEVRFDKSPPRCCWIGRWTRGPPPRSKLDFIGYENKGQEESVITPHYVQVLPRGGLFFKDLFISARAGGNGKDLFDRLKMRSEMTIIGGIKFDFSDSDFRSAVTGVRDGPVRVIRRNKTALELFLGLSTPSVTVDALFYRDSYEVPSTLNIPFRVDLVAREMIYYQGCDLSLAAGPYRFYSDQSEGPVTMDGQMSRTEREMTRSGAEHQWGLVSGEAGSLAYLAEWAEPDTPVGIKLFYMDDKDVADPPEDEPGLSMYGFELVNPLELAKKAYDLNIIVYVLPGFEGEVSEDIASIRAPLEITVKKME